MEKSVSRRAKIRKYLYLIFVIAALSAGLIASSVKAQRLTRQITASSQRSLSELGSYISSINTSLKKGMYANTPTMMDEMSTDLSKYASGAKSSLASLPISDLQLDNTYKFLSQVGAFIFILNKKVAAGEKISDEEREELSGLLSVSDALSSEISEILRGVQDGTVSLEDTESTLKSDDDEIKNLSTVLSDAEQTASDYPTLIYDGPFSDHILNMSPKLTEGKQEISKEDALKIAADFVGANEADISFDGEGEGTLPSYMFSAENCSLAVSKKGGYVLYMLGSSYAGEEKITQEQAIESAAEFLSSKGFENMKDSYYSVSDGICTINFAYMQGDVICYPDLIKVSVSLETGEIISFDGRGYIMNHCERTVNQPAADEETAKQSVSPYLTVISSRRAVIPTDSQGEKSVYEFHCKDENGDEALIYIDENTGYEDDILLLLYSDGGILTK